MCKRDTESVKVAPKSVLSNRGNLEGTHLTRFSPGGGLSPGGISVHLAGRALPSLYMENVFLWYAWISFCLIEAYRI